MLSAYVGITRLIIMAHKRDFNVNMVARLAACRLLWVLPVVAGLACGARTVSQSVITANPVEILERSPRIYHIGFEPIADSVETARLSMYLMGSIGTGAYLSSLDLGPDTPYAVSPAWGDYLKARRRFEGGATGAAAKHLKNALELDPGFQPSYLLLGKLLFMQGRIKEAEDIYTKVVTWDVTNSEALAGLAKCFMALGQLDNARRALVDAVIFDRANLEAWENLNILGAVQQFEVTGHDAPELSLIRKQRGRHLALIIDASLEECPMQATAWIVFASQRAVWRYEGKYKQYMGVSKYQPTYEEDVDCFMALAAAWKVLSQQDTTVCDSNYFDHLDQVADEGYLVPHVLFDYVCVRDPLAARDFSTEVIDELRKYINQYVLVPRG
jgi:tetratricopeptide (TPR) repeat protein